MFNALFHLSSAFSTKKRSKIDNISVAKRRIFGKLESIFKYKGKTKFMAEELIGNVLVAQSGGPTAVINASLAGVITEALNHECIEEIYGGLNGIAGIMNEQLIDLAAESQQNIRGLRHTPGAALGTCRFKLKKEQDYARVIEVCIAHNIRYFFYIGGNDSQDTANKMSIAAEKFGHKMRVIGIPKTIDNDLPVTDHCPGYGSVVKYIASTIRELSCDHEAMGNHDLVSIVELMGRNAGWITAGAAIAKRKNHPEDAPHIVLLPEVAFNAENFIARVQEVLKENKFCLVAVSEGLKDENGNYVAASTSTDAFGHSQLGGVGEYLENLVSTSLPGVKARSSKLGHIQRAASTVSSLADSNEAFLCGQEAVKAAVEGQSGLMVALVRGDTEKYSCSTTMIPLSDVANVEKKFPELWLGEDKMSISYKFNKYILPLIQGEVQVPYENGLPNFVKLSKVMVEPKLPSYNFGE